MLERDKYTFRVINQEGIVKRYRYDIIDAAKLLRLIAME
nr:MAG TPA: hypothetical protein [Caudoviricetes sp.]